MSNKLAEAIERVRRDNEGESRLVREDVLAVRDAAQRCVEAEYKLELTGLDRDLHKAAHLEARHERDEARAEAEHAQQSHADVCRVLGDEARRLLAEEQRAHARTAQECREAREAADHWFTEANRDHNDLVRATETLAGIEQLLRAKYIIEYEADCWHYYQPQTDGACVGPFESMAAAVQAAIEELDKETK